VLLVRHGRTGSSGFIINRPTQFDVGDVTKKLPQFESNPLYLGGDIGEGVYMIHGVPGLENATEVSDGIFYGGSDEVEDFVRSGRAAPQDFRFFFKYTAWLPGQLENEINAGCWCPVRTSLDLVLQRRNYAGLHYSKHHKVFWHQVRPLDSAAHGRALWCLVRELPIPLAYIASNLISQHLRRRITDSTATRRALCQHISRYDCEGGDGAHKGRGMDRRAARWRKPGA
jgi:putative AlgH/UPF0301 family transcriptional regulator